MAARYFNWKLATVLLVAVGILTVAAYVLHRWQVSNRAVQALPLGMNAYAKQDYDEAAIQLGNYLRVNAEDVDVLLKFADAQLKRRPIVRGNITMAYNAYRSVLRLDPRNLKAAQTLVEAYLARPESVVEAELIARRFLEESENARMRVLHAGALRLLRKPADAVAELKKSLEQHPEDVASYEEMANLAESSEVVDKPAAFWLDEAVAQNPQSALAYVARAGFYWRTKLREKARADLEQAQKCDLPDTETRSRLVGTLLRAKLLDQAREQLKAWQTQDPAALWLWRSWAYLARYAKAPEEMYMVAQAGLKALAPQPWDFMPTAAELLIRSDHVEEAKSYIAQMQEKDIAPADVLYLNGLVADKEGRLRDAVGDWRKAVALGANVRQTLARALAGLGDVQSAVGELRILVTETPNDAGAHLDLAKLLAQTRDWPGAMNEARQAQQLAEDDPETHGEATRLTLQARTQLLAAAPRSAGEQEKDWQDIETQLAELDKTEKGSLPTRLLQTQIALARGKLPEAASLLADLEAKYPSEVKVPLLQAELCLRQNKKDEAQSRLQAAVTKFPQALEPVQSLALLLDQPNQHEACAGVIREGLARIQEPRLRRDLFLILADLYRLWQQEDKLVACLHDWAAQFPSDIQPRRQLLACPEVVQEARQAQNLVEEIKSLEGDSGWQWRYEQARLWHDGGAEDFKTQYSQIVKLLQDNLAANPQDLESCLLLADTYVKANELPLAATTYQQAHRLRPGNVPLLVRTVAVLLQAKEVDGARALLNEAQQRGLQSPDLDRLGMQVDFQKGNLPAVASALEKRVARDPNDLSSLLSLALIRLQERKYEAAQQALDTLKAKPPNPKVKPLDEMEVLHTQIRLYAEQGKADQAIPLCDQIVAKLHNTAAYAMRAQVYVTLRLSTQRQYALKPYDPKQYEKTLRDLDEKALADFGQIITLDPQKAEGWAARADFYRVSGRVREGLTDVRKALELVPDNLAFQKLAALLMIASGESSLLSEAGALLDKALAAFDQAPPTNAEEARMRDYAQLRLLKAQILMSKGTGPGIESARRLLREVTASEPKMAEGWQWLARLELSQEDPARAAAAALQGLTDNPDNGDLLLLKARAEKVHQPSVAALTLKGLLDQNPDSIEVVVELADAYARCGRTQQAVDLLRQKVPELGGLARRRCEIAEAEALYANGQREEAKTLFAQLSQAEPNDPTPTMSLAQQLRRERRWTEMNQLVRRWLSVHPQDAGVATAIARVLAATGDKQAFLMGEDILRTTLEHNPRSLPALLLLAMMMQNVDRNEEAAKLNRQILEMDPQSVVALNNLAWILADQENQPQQYPEALKLAQRGLDIAPDYGDLLDTRGYAFFRLGEFEKALADFGKCIELYPANAPSAATPYFHQAMTYAAMKRTAEAVQCLQKALGLDRTSLRIAKEQADAGHVTYAVKLLKDTLQLHDQMETLRTTLLPADSPALSPQDLADAKGLLEQLQKGI